MWETVKNKFRIKPNGYFGGPCPPYKKCNHETCKELNRIVNTICPYCKKEIGFFQWYVNKVHETKIREVHYICYLEFEKKNLK